MSHYNENKTWKDSLIENMLHNYKLLNPFIETRQQTNKHRLEIKWENFITSHKETILTPFSFSFFLFFWSVKISWNSVPIHLLERILLICNESNKSSNTSNQILWFSFSNSTSLYSLIYAAMSAMQSSNITFVMHSDRSSKSGENVITVKNGKKENRGWTCSQVEAKL